MSRIIVVLAPVGLAVAGLMIDMAQAQPCTNPTRRARLFVSDNSASGRDTLWFGIHDSATAGIDPQFCEVEFPPFPPLGVFEARWMNPPGREGLEPPAGLGQGVKLDYRRHVSAAQIDTHRVKFQPNDPPGYPVKFKWVRSEVAQICDSCILVDEFGGVIIPRTRMTVQDSLVVNLSAIQSLLMFQYGAKMTGVEQRPEGVPGSFALEQNYPNPFNPSTTIRFAIQRGAFTDISVYDILGRKVASLASEMLTPGYYTVQWNGTNSMGNSVASGVYFVRMHAQSDNGNFSALRKLLFMK
jgi:hypothetical protein